MLDLRFSYEGCSRQAVLDILNESSTPESSIPRLPDPGYTGTMILQNIQNYSPDDIASYLLTLESSMPFNFIL
jgi:hypothetical protein